MEGLEPLNCTWEISPEKEKDIDVFKPNASLRGYLLRNKNSQTSYLGKERKDKMTARIINFSFIEQSRPDNRRFSSKQEYPELPKKGRRDMANFNNCVLDLSGDGNNRTTYVSMLRDRVFSNEPERGGVTFCSNSPRKVSMRLEELKQRRSYLEDYKI